MHAERGALEAELHFAIREKREDERSHLRTLPRSQCRAKIKSTLITLEITFVLDRVAQ